MKKIVLLFIVIFASATAFSQDFKKFRVGIGTGYASPGGSGAKGGILLYLEPSYRVTDAFAVGLRAEIAVMARGTVTGSGSAASFDGSVSGNGSYTLNGQYYFSNGGFRPFAGLGLGFYSLASATVNGSSSSEAVSGGTKFGFYPRVGFDAKHFVFTIEYNVLANSKSPYAYTNSNGQLTAGSIESKNNYLAVKLGFFIGGGRN